MVFKALNRLLGRTADPGFVTAEMAGKANLGCGQVYHPAWLNFDLCPCSLQVRPIDLGRSLPFPDGSLETVYSSHVVEHLPRGRVSFFLAECRRVLRPGGIIRLVVPDLEASAREYLRQLEATERGEPGAEERHEWMTVELLDQLVRRVSGGCMARWWRTRPLLARDLIETRLGAEAAVWIRRFEDEAKSGGSLLSREEIYQVREPPGEKMARFLAQGEAHRWMYDRISLARLLREAGFEEPKVCAAAESRIKDFASYDLDTDENGKPRKPDSLFMEAIKSG